MLNSLYINKKGDMNRQLFLLLSPQDFLDTDDLLCFYWKDNCTADIVIQYGELKE